MLIPLGVLALGAVFSGMLWYNDFFGEHSRVTAFFGIPSHEAAEGAAEGAAPEGAAEATSEGTATTTSEGEATDAPAVTAEPAAVEGVAADHGAGQAPQGAIFMAPDNDVMTRAHESPVWVKVSPFVAMIIGFVTAWIFYIRDPSIPGRLAAQQPILYRFLLNKWYFDEIYDAIFVRPAKTIGAFLWRRGDGNVIDGSINGVALGIIPYFTRLAGRAQSGYLFHYAFAMVIGIAVLLVWMTLSGGAH